MTNEAVERRQSAIFSDKLLIGLVETVWNDKVHGDKFTKRKLKVTVSRELRLPTGPLI